MKIQQIVSLTTLLLFLTLLLPKSSLAFEDFEGEEEDCPSHVEDDELENEEALQEFLKEVEKAKEQLGPWPEQCDNLAECEEKIEDYKAILENEHDMLWARIDATIDVANEKMAITENFKREINLMKNSINESRSTVESASNDLEASKKAIEDAERSLSACTASSESKIKELESKVAYAKSKSSQYKDARFIFNMDNIKSDIKGFLKKHGLVKEEL